MENDITVNGWIPFGDDISEAYLENAEGAEIGHVFYSDSSQNFEAEVAGIGNIGKIFKTSAAAKRAIRKKLDKRS